MSARESLISARHIEWQTYAPSGIVHAMYPDEDLRDYDFARDRYFPVKQAVCGMRADPEKFVPDEGGYACNRCAKVAKAQSLSLPAREINSLFRPPYRYEFSEHGPATIYDAVDVGWVARVKESLPHKEALAKAMVDGLNRAAGVGR